MTEYTISPDRYAKITLSSGAHASPEDGMCLMEAVAFLAGEQHSDRPQCVSPMLGSLGRNLNDHLSDDRRQSLVALIPSLLGTTGDGHDEARLYMALDWLIHTWLPTWLDLVPECWEDAARVRDLDRVVDRASTHCARVAVQTAEENADAVRGVAGEAVRDAIWGVVRDAVWDSSGDAIWGVVNNAMCGDLEDVVRDVLWDAVSAVTRAVARSAVGNVALASEFATKAALSPIVDALQLSVIDLYTEMIKAPWTL